ncbi:unnamed protein product [Schistosoma margrebowiei]|uniref:Uncharacterized protein n=1 Tax=Schistosoma margrebowiei TaxID=48269 RepID=A0A183N1H8_9TREM|nr:unnamed protein product [Schistosoma margrebowiei]
MTKVLKYSIYIYTIYTEREKGREIFKLLNGEKNKIYAKIIGSYYHAYTVQGLSKRSDCNKFMGFGFYGSYYNKINKLWKNGMQNLICRVLKPIKYFLLRGLIYRIKFSIFLNFSTELSCCIAIDFTASNGSPQVPGTLHYSTVTQPSQYAVALQAVGEIISDYDSDNLFPSFGFGACIPPDNNVSHCFPLNGHMDNPYCEGIQGAMAAYAHSLRTVKFHGPTNFAPIINTVASIARQSVDGSQYSILLILTDGIISDLPQTKAAIVNASSLPLSIIIVGVGPANFDEMEELDGDEVRLSSRGKTAIRDIVQVICENLSHVSTLKLSLN